MFSSSLIHIFILPFIIILFFNLTLIVAALVFFQLERDAVAYVRINLGKHSCDIYGWETFSK